MYFESYIYHIITITNCKYQLVDAIQITDGEKVKITIIKVELEDEDRMKSICSVYSIKFVSYTLKLCPTGQISTSGLII